MNKIIEIAQLFSMHITTILTISNGMFKSDYTNDAQYKHTYIKAFSLAVLAKIS